MKSGWSVQIAGGGDWDRTQHCKTCGPKGGYRRSGDNESGHVKSGPTEAFMEAPKAPSHAPASSLLTSIIPIYWHRTPNPSWCNMHNLV